MIATSQRMSEPTEPSSLNAPTDPNTCASKALDYPTTADRLGRGFRWNFKKIFDAVWAWVVFAVAAPVVIIIVVVDEVREWRMRWNLSRIAAHPIYMAVLIPAYALAVVATWAEDAWWWGRCLYKRMVQ